MENKMAEHFEEQTSGHRQSYWLHTEPQFDSAPLTNSIITDVVVVGAGISGLSTALKLLEDGKKVIVVEDGLVGSGESGRTTGHITPTLDDRYSYLASRFGKDKARLAAQSHWTALEWIARNVDTYQIDCHFKRVDGYLFLHESDRQSTLDKEFDASQQAGLQVIAVDSIPHITGVSNGLRFPNHAQFHILKYLNGLCKAILSLGGQIYCHSRATSISENEVIVNGHAVRARHVVVATNSPVNDMVSMHTKQFPYRTYVCGALVPRSAMEPALWWDTGDRNSKWVTEPYHYARLEEYDHEHYLLIVGGADHKTGQADKEDVPEEDRYLQLEHWIKRHVPQAGEVVYRWSGQVMEPLDGLAFIGRNPGNKEVYIITGDSGNGMTHGTLGGLLVADLIAGKENAWAELYDPSRMMWRTPVDFASESLSMVAQYTDWLSKSELDTIFQLSANEGAVMQSGVKKYAVYRDESSKFHAFSAVCPHLGCILKWNQDERSFDCPCHGSRFTCFGKLVNGPAISDLKEIDPNEFNKKFFE